MKNKSVERINSIDEHGKKINIHPAEVKGIFRKWRTIVQVVLMAVFLVTPWTTINDLQTVLINIPDREFYFFGTLFRSHNAPLLLFVGLGATLTLAFVTSIWGRVWCGWACPQTVFIDGVFRRIEYWIEGNYVKRTLLEKSELTIKDIFKKAIKWFLFFVVSVIISHSFLAYFVGAREFFKIIEDGPSASWTTFLIAQFFTFIFLLDFGWFREQFCTIMCPYGRIQGLLLDKNSLVVEYKEERNDCVKCNRCVVACPVGIDIRHGLQMECIACTACIDACDEIMDKVKKPRGLIKYDTLDHKKINLLKPKALLYMLGILLCVGGLIYSVATKQHSQAFFMRAKDMPFQKVEDGSTTIILNHFKIHLTNQDHVDHEYEIELQPAGFSLVSANNSMVLKPKEFKEWHLFIKREFSQFKPNEKIRVILKDHKDPKIYSQEFESVFSGPSL